MALLPATIASGLATYLVVGVGAVAFGGGWWLGDRLETVNTLKAERRVEELERTVAEAKRREEARAELVTEKFRSLAREQAAQEQLERMKYAEAQKQINELASRTRQCLSPDVVRVLRRRAEDRRNAEGGDSRQPPRPGPTVARAEAGSVLGGVSEHAMSSYLNQVEEQYVSLRKRHTNLAQKIPELPCVKIDPTR